LKIEIAEFKNRYQSIAMMRSNYDYLASRSRLNTLAATAHGVDDILQCQGPWG
jgi:hypothetical protein